MNDSLKLPPLPFPVRATQADYSSGDMQAYATATAEPYRKALHDLIRDLEMRAEDGVVDCGDGVYERAKRALGEL